MRDKLIVLLLVGIMFISFSSAIEQDLGTAVRGDCINLVQTCDTCTINNISRVLFPNSTTANEEEINMSRDGTYFNASFLYFCVVFAYKSSLF